MDELAAMRKDLHTAGTSLKNAMESLILRGEHLSDLESRANDLLGASEEYKNKQNRLIGLSLCSKFTRALQNIFSLLRTVTLNTFEIIVENMHYHSSINFFRDSPSHTGGALRTSIPMCAGSTGPNATGSTPALTVPQYKEV